MLATFPACAIQIKSSPVEIDYLDIKVSVVPGLWRGTELKEQS